MRKDYLNNIPLYRQHINATYYIKSAGYIDSDEIIALFKFLDSNYTTEVTVYRKDVVVDSYYLGYDNTTGPIIKGLQFCVGELYHYTNYQEHIPLSDAIFGEFQIDYIKSKSLYDYFTESVVDIISHYLSEQNIVKTLAQYIKYRKVYNDILDKTLTDIMKSS